MGIVAQDEETRVSHRLGCGRLTRKGPAPGLGLEMVSELISDWIHTFRPELMIRRAIDLCTVSQLNSRR